MGPMVLSAAAKKRLASEALKGEEEQRFYKRFSSLNIGKRHKNNHYDTASDLDSAPISPPESVQSTQDEEQKNKHNNNDDPADDDEWMDVEDTKHRVFVRNLTHELRAIEEEERIHNPLILPGLEKLVDMPRSLLARPPPEPECSLVLYGVPASLSLEGEGDGVGRALKDARERARERFLERHRGDGGGGEVRGSVKGEGGEVPKGAASEVVPAVDYDEDAMEIDEEF